jgi:hypothetical protein
MERPTRLIPLLRCWGTGVGGAVEMPSNGRWSGPCDESNAVLLASWQRVERKRRGDPTSACYAASAEAVVFQFQGRSSSRRVAG